MIDSIERAAVPHDGIPLPDAEHTVVFRYDKEFLTHATGTQLNLLEYTEIISSLEQQEGLAVASIARDDSSPLPGMHRDYNALPSQTDRRKLTS